MSPGGTANIDSLQRLVGETPILSSGIYQLVASRLVESGRIGEAGPVLDLALRSYPRDPVLHAARGRAWLALGDRRRAAMAFSRALAIDPLNPYALEGREQLLRPGSDSHP
jgi:Flp pilus assembly protein TadD